MKEEIVKLFEKEIHNSFDTFLKEYSFDCTKSSADADQFCVTYRKDELYILIGGTLKPEDYPFYLYATFGEGSDESPEADWNSAPLWRIMQCVSPDDYKNYLHIFDIISGIKEDQIADQILTCRELCRECAKEFLEGDLAVFRFARTEQNRDREPYKIFVLDSNGKYQMTYEENSAALKQKYS
jgi:hypothetical protein